MSFSDRIVLHYDMLKLNPPIEYESDPESIWYPRDVVIDVIEWDYAPGDDEVFNYFVDYRENYEELKDFEELETTEQEEACFKYVKEHLEELAGKYEEDLLDFFEEDAEEDARENYEPPDPSEYGIDDWDE